MAIRDVMPDDLADRIRGEFDSVRERVIRSLPQSRARRARRERVLAFFAGLGAGLAAAYLFDTRLGRTRRSRLADQAAAAGRDAAGEATRFGRRVASDVKGRMEAARHGANEYRPPNDATLARKVESEVLGRPDLPKGSILVNAEEGAVALRGEVPDPELIEELVELVKGVDGVRYVENYLHLPGEPAPNKESVRGRA